MRAPPATAWQRQMETGGAGGAAAAACPCPRTARGGGGDASAPQLAVEGWRRAATGLAWEWVAPDDQWKGRRPPSAVGRGRRRRGTTAPTEDGDGAPPPHPPAWMGRGVGKGGAAGERAGGKSEGSGIGAQVGSYRTASLAGSKSPTLFGGAPQQLPPAWPNCHPRPIQAWLAALPPPPPLPSWLNFLFLPAARRGDGGGWGGMAGGWAGPRRSGRAAPPPSQTPRQPPSQNPRLPPRAPRRAV